MKRLRRQITIAALAGLLAVGMSAVPPGHVASAQDGYRTSQDSRSGFNDEYVFATTRAVNDMEGVNPAIKITLFPVTILLDTAFLPFAVIAGFVT